MVAAAGWPRQGGGYVNQGRRHQPAAGLASGSSSPLMARTGCPIPAMPPSGSFEAVQGHQTAEGIDVPQSARHLVSVIDGLRWPVLFGVYAGHEALDVPDAQLDRIFGTARYNPPQSVMDGHPDAGLQHVLYAEKSDLDLE
jgi:hypothetical protein